MSSKCAIYLRVSSDLQDYERQISDMKKFAKNNHFTFSNKNLYEDKLSGFKNEKERDGLRKMLNDVIAEEIKIILVWEISRLARKHRDLLEITEFFQNNGINVYFYIQRFWLLDETSNISPQAGLSIAFFGWHGEYEARLTKERFLSAKRLNESLGKYNGGKITFGYTVDENNNYAINNNIIKGLQVSESDIVREVFNLYEEGLTCSKICRICRSRNYPLMVCNTHTLARLLRDTSYIGFKKVKLGKRPTPPIISESQFYTVGALIDANKTKADKGKKHIYLLRGVLKCSYCNEYYVGKQTDDAYICPKNSGSNKTNKNTSCKGGNISISNIDGIIWDLVKDVLLMRETKGYDDTFKLNKFEINELEKQITQYIALIKKLEQKKKKANIIFQNDGYSVEEYQKAIRGINNEIKECEKEIIVIESRIRYIKKVMEESNTITKRLENIESIIDRHQMQSIIRNVIKEIFFYKVTDFKTVVNVIYHTGQYEWLYYNSVSKKGTTYKLSNANYIKFDKETNLFYVLKDIKNVKQWILKDDTEKTKNEIPLKTLTRLSNPINPIPDKTNSYVYDFDGIMNIPDIPYILDTKNYSKLTYFKDLNKSRFNRKKYTKIKA